MKPNDAGDNASGEESSAESIEDIAKPGEFSDVDGSEREVEEVAEEVEVVNEIFGAGSDEDGGDGGDDDSDEDEWDLDVDFDDDRMEIDEGDGGGVNSGLQSFVSHDSRVFISREEDYDSDYAWLIETNSPQQLWSKATDYFTPKKHEDDDPRIPQKAEKFAAAALLAERPWICVRESSDAPSEYDLRYYDEDRGHFDADGVTEAVIRCRAVLDGWAAKSNIRSIIEIVATQTMCSRDALNAPDSDEFLVPVKNGVLVLDSIDYDPATGSIDLDSIELRDHHPEYRWAFSLPVKWDPETADLEFVDGWTQKLSGDNEVIENTMWEFGGHALLPGQFIEAFGVFIGGGSDGKTEWLENLGSVLGEENTTGIPIDKIANEKFSSWRMANALANINPDIEGTKLTEIGAVKNFTGGDRVEVERKNQDPFDTRSRATQIYGANEPPAIAEKTFAVKRRLMPIHIKSRFRADPDPDNPFEFERDPRFDAKRQRDAVLEGMLVRMVEGAVRLMHQERFSLAQEFGPDERMEMYEQSADPVAEFARVCLARDSEGAVANEDLKACYDSFARDRDHPSKSLQSLVQVLKNKRDTVLRKSRTRSWTEGDDRITIQKGMSFTEEAKKHWLPEDAHWEQYGGRLDADDGGEDGDGVDVEGAERVHLSDVLEAGAGRLRGQFLRVTCDMELDARPWLSSECVVRDDSATMAVQVREGAGDEYDLMECEEYLVEDAAVRDPDGEQIALEIVPGQTRVIKLATDGEQQSIVDSGSDGDGSSDGDEGDDASDANSDGGDGENLTGDVRRVLRELSDADGDIEADDKEELVAMVAEELGADYDGVWVVISDIMMDGEVYEPKSGTWRVTEKCIN